MAVPPQELPPLDELKQRIQRQKGEKEEATHLASRNSAKYAGVDFVVNVGTGGGLGYFLDMEFDTKPWLMFIGLLLGMASGFLHLIRQAEKFSQEEHENPEEKKDDVSVQ